MSPESSSVGLTNAVFEVQHAAKRAAVKLNPVHDLTGGRWLVVRYTHYLDRWYYDGPSTFDTREEAEAYAKAWVAKEGHAP